MTDSTLPPGSDDDDFELVVSVAARISRISSVILAGLDTPLTFRQYRTLSRVMAGYTRLQQLARRANLSLPTVSENVDGLVKRGLMRTTRDTADRRAILLDVTDAGAEAAQAGHRAITEFVSHLVDGLDSEEREHFRTSVRHVFGAATDYFVNHVDPSRADKEIV